MKAIKEKARRENLSLNKAVVALLEEATSSRTGKKARTRDLDHLAGTWSEQEYEQLMSALREQRQVDPEMWK